MAVKAGPITILAVLFAFVWLGIYTIALANQVNTNGLSFGALGEMIPLLAGVPILLLSLTKKFSPLGILLGFAGIVLLFGDSILFLNPLVSTQVVRSLQALSAAGSNLVYQTSPQSLVVTIMAFATAEESPGPSRY